MPRTTKPKPICKDKDYNGPFPLQDDPDFLSLKPQKQKFVHNIFLQPTTNWSNGKCYQDAYGNPNINSCHVCAHYLLNNDKIVALCVEKIRLAYRESLNLTSERVLKELGCISFSDLVDFFDSDGFLIVHPRDLPEAARRAIAGFEALMQIDGSIKYKVKLWSKTEGLKQITSVLGMNAPIKTKSEISGPGGGPIETKVTHTIDFSQLTDDELNVLLKLIDKQDD